MVATARYVEDSFLYFALSGYTVMHAALGHRKQNWPVWQKM